MKLLRNSVLFVIFTFYSSLFSQETDNSIKQDSLKVKRFSIGVRIGIPTVVGGSAEIVLPLFNNHFAPFVNYSSFSLSFKEVETNLSFIGFGTIYYFGENGSGFFISVGRNTLKTDIIFGDLLFVDNTSLQSFIGSGGTLLKINTSDIKIGIKTAGAFYFLFELGYGIGKIPDELKFTATSNGISDSFIEEVPPIPGLGSNGVLFGNVGFGLSF